MILFFGLVVDSGGWYTDISKLQKGADAASIAGAVFYVYGDNNANGPCVGLDPGAIDPNRINDRATACAAHVAALNNMPLAAASPLIVTGVGGSDAVEVDAHNTSPPNFIARNFLGVNPSTTATSAASIYGPGSMENVVPVGVSDISASHWADDTQLTLTFVKDKGITGNDFTLLKNNFGCQGVRGVKTCFKNGGCGQTCSPEPTVGDDLKFDSGNNWKNVMDDWGTYIATPNKTVYAAIYDYQTALIVGFAELQVGTDYSDTTITVTFVQSLGLAPSGPPDAGKFFGLGSISLTT